jgi:hypothetical protein
MEVFRLLHPPTKVDFPPFVDDFHHEMKVTLNQETFVFVLAPSPHLLIGGPLGMVYGLLQNNFVSNDSRSNFNLFFEVCGHIVQCDVPFSVSSLLSAFQLLMSKK